MKALLAHLTWPTTGWLLRMGVARAVIATTAFSTLVSVSISLAINVLRNELHPLVDWLLPSTLVPVIVTPGIAYAFLSLAWRLETAKAALQRAATTDALTGACNRHDLLDNRLALLPAQRPFGVLMLDIDHFKAINDADGHGAGDAVLVAVTRTCQARLRTSDIFCRWGGEEFLAVLPGCDLQGAVRVAENLRGAVAAMRVPEASRPVTVSIGIAVSGAESGTFAEVLNEADRQLYRAKKAGRDRIMHAATGLDLVPTPRGKDLPRRKAAVRIGRPA